jgi:hypothetical protein
LIEVPFLVITLDEIEIASLERVGMSKKSFDMTIVFKVGYPPASPSGPPPRLAHCCFCCASNAPASLTLGLSLPSAWECWPPPFFEKSFSRGRGPQPEQIQSAQLSQHVTTLSPL